MYRSGEEVAVGDHVLCVKMMQQKIVKGEKLSVPMRGEIVPPCTFMESPGDAACVVFHEDNIWSSYNSKSIELPHKNGGFAFIKPQDLRFQSRGVEGQGVLDPLPQTERSKHDEDE